MKTITRLYRNTRTQQRATASNLKAHGLKAIASRLRSALGWVITVSGTITLPSFTSGVQAHTKRLSKCVNAKGNAVQVLTKQSRLQGML